MVKRILLINQFFAVRLLRGMRYWLLLNFQGLVVDKIETLFSITETRRVVPSISF